MNRMKSIIFVAGLMSLVSSATWAHDPIFSIGPHVLFKGGFEIAPEVRVSKKGDEHETELGLEATYGITGDWAAGVDIPYNFKSNDRNSGDGFGNFGVFTKYRFWRHDTLGAQETAAVLAKVFTDTGANRRPAVSTGTTDGILGLTYGYESRKWYRWASVRYRYNGKNDAGLRRGNKILVDLVGGIRPVPTDYLEPDTVWLLELNGEYGERAESRGVNLANTGGTELFLSPGIFWTKRNFAIKAGVQIPVYHNLNGRQKESDYRAKLVFEWHL